MSDTPTPTPATDHLFPDDHESDIDYDTPAAMPDEHSEARERCSWHLRMASAARREYDEITAVYAAEMARLEERLLHRQRIIRERIDWHETPVQAFHLALVESEPKRKTIDLPYGTSRVTVPKTPRIEFVDKAATLAWAEQTHPEILGHTINVTGVKQITTPGPMRDGNIIDTDTGEIIPGVQAVIDPPRWGVSYDSA